MVPIRFAIEIPVVVLEATVKKRRSRHRTLFIPKEGEISIKPPEDG